MKSRLAMAIAAGVAVHYFVYWVPCALLIPTEHYWLATIVSVVCGIAAGRFVWRRSATAENGVAAYMLLGALVVGGIGFVVGFFGPMLLAPGANQGPLLGLFITGPLGFLAGGVGGLLYGLNRRASLPR